MYPSSDGFDLNLIPTPLPDTSSKAGGAASAARSCPRATSRPPTSPGPPGSSDAPMTPRPVCNLISLPPHPSMFTVANIQIARCIIFVSQHYQEQTGVHVHRVACHHLDLPFQSPRHFTKPASSSLSVESCGFLEAFHGGFHENQAQW